MPSSFSRFLSDAELKRVRELYLESLKDAPAEEGAQPEAAPPPPAPEAGESQKTEQ